MVDDRAPGTALVGTAAFTGREPDVDTEYYYRARYYDATSGRFMSSDPIEFAGGLNTYQYAVNNPLKYRDPNGLDAWLSGEGNAGLHFGLVGVNGGAGLVFNPATWEACAYG